MQQRNEIELQEKTGCIEGLQQQIASLQTEWSATVAVMSYVLQGIGEGHGFAPQK